jgi:hypothetical protein
MQVYVCDSFMALVVVQILENQSAVTKSCACLLLLLKELAKQDACIAACTDIVKNYMAAMKRMDNIIDLWNNEPNAHQSDDKELDDNDKAGPDTVSPCPHAANKVQEGDPPKADNNPSANMDEVQQDNLPQVRMRQMRIQKEINLKRTTRLPPSRMMTNRKDLQEKFQKLTPFSQNDVLL